MLMCFFFWFCPSLFFFYTQLEKFEKVFVVFLFGVEVDGELMEVTIEFGFDFDKGASWTFIRSRLVGPNGGHDEPRLWT